MSVLAWIEWFKTHCLLAAQGHNVRQGNNKTVSQEIYILSFFLNLSEIFSEFNNIICEVNSERY